MQIQKVKSCPDFASVDLTSDTLTLVLTLQSSHCTSACDELEAGEPSESPDVSARHFYCIDREVSIDSLSLR